jgi:hypothetical protein
MKIFYYLGYDDQWGYEGQVAPGDEENLEQGKLPLDDSFLKE